MVLNHIAAKFGAIDNVAANDMRHIAVCFWSVLTYMTDGMKKWKRRASAAHVT